MSEQGKSAKDVRREKLEAALKENLRRRKAQARARKPAPERGESGEAPEPPFSGPKGAELPD